MAEYFTRVVRGLEWIAGAEISATVNGQVKEVSHRLIRFRSESSRRDLAQLGTVDDIFAEEAYISGIDGTRASIEKLQTLPSVIRSSSLPRGPFDVVASFVGRRNYSRFDIEDAIGRELEKITGGKYISRRHGKVDNVTQSWRVHLMDDRALLGRRFISHPLHRRTYRERLQSGALHPPVASAMTLLSDIKLGENLLDPCCGSGTILLEAKTRMSSFEAIGFDIEVDRIEAARINAAKLRADVQIAAADVGLLPLRSKAVHHCVTNLPWGAQVAPSGTLVKGRTKLWQELRRVLRDDGKILILTEEKILKQELESHGLRELLCQAIRLSGRSAFIQMLVNAQGDIVKPFAGGSKATVMIERWYRIRDRIESRISGDRNTLLFPKPLSFND